MVADIPNAKRDPATSEITDQVPNQVRNLIGSSGITKTMHLFPRKRALLFVVLAQTVAFANLAIANLGQDVVAKSAAEARPISAGKSIPRATLKGIDGKAISLKDAVAGKPTVIIFYRGGWCPFCNAHLSDLAKVEAEVRAKGYQIIAISPDIPTELAKTVDKDHLTYRLFSDSSAEAMKKFGVAFRVDDETYTMYRDRFKLDLEVSSGQKHHILPVPSVFVVNPMGKITFAKSDPDYKVRIKGTDLLKALDSE